VVLVESPAPFGRGHRGIELRHLAGAPGDTVVTQPPMRF
jgi:hypothetical protein